MAGRLLSGAGGAAGLGSGRMTTDAPTDLHALAEELLGTATSEPAGRAGRTLAHPVDGLRQTVIALRSGTELGAHESPGPARRRRRRTRRRRAGPSRRSAGCSPTGAR